MTVDGPREPRSKSSKYLPLVQEGVGVYGAGEREWQRPQPEAKHKPRPEQEPFLEIITGRNTGAAWKSDAAQDVLLFPPFLSLSPALSLT